jgi:hypothetical protein
MANWNNVAAANAASFGNMSLANELNAQAPQAMNMGGLFQGASSGLQDILKQLQTAQNQANQANQQRYQDILGMYSNLGKTGEARIAENEAQQQAKSTQDLTSRGLGNTTITGAMSRGIASDAEFARQGLQEQVAQLQGGVMERKTEQGPNLGLYASLIQQAMAGQQAGQQRTITQYAPTYQAGGWNPAAYAATPKGPLNNSGGYNQGTQVDKNGQPVYY